MPSDAEKTSRRERRHVTRAIKHAFALIGEHDPALATLFRETIETGEFLSYSPESGTFAKKKSARRRTKLTLSGDEGVRPRKI